jgi:predicted adenylyl cyclase CyaB
MKYEIEVKVLLGSQAAAADLLAKLGGDDPDFAKFDEQKQLNHYFKEGDLGNLAKKFEDILTGEQVSQIDNLAQNAKSFNVRSRQKNDKVLLIIKGSLDERSAAHSNQRMELEFEIDMTIDELDDKVLRSGFKLEAKWSAERGLYKYRDMVIDMIFSPGYGHMVEFEKVVDDEKKVEPARQNILNLLKKLGLNEFDHELIEKMFAYYNEHWREYYGTRKTFTL